MSSNQNSKGRDQISVSGPLDDEEMAKLREYLHIEMTEEGGADPGVHGLYDYYETTKRLVDTVEREAKSADEWMCRALAAEAAAGKVRIFPPKISTPPMSEEDKRNLASVIAPVPRYACCGAEIGPEATTGSAWVHLECSGRKP